MEELTKLREPIIQEETRFVSKLPRAWATNYATLIVSGLAKPPSKHSLKLLEPYAERCPSCGNTLRFSSVEKCCQAPLAALAKRTREALWINGNREFVCATGTELIS